MDKSITIQTPFERIRRSISEVYALGNRSLAGRTAQGQIDRQVYAQFLMVCAKHGLIDCYPPAKVGTLIFPSSHNDAEGAIESAITEHARAWFDRLDAVSAAHANSDPHKKEWALHTQGQPYHNIVLACSRNGIVKNYSMYGDDRGITFVWPKRIMVQEDGAAERAATLREQALSLMRQAEELDGLKPYNVIHARGFGTSGQIGWFKSRPSADEAAQLLCSKIGPNEDMVTQSIALEEVTGQAAGNDLQDHDYQQSIRERP